MNRTRPFFTRLQQGSEWRQDEGREIVRCLNRTRELLGAAADFVDYEISNFAKSGRDFVPCHNLALLARRGLSGTWPQRVLNHCDGMTLEATCGGHGGLMWTLINAGADRCANRTWKKSGSAYPRRRRANHVRACACAKEWTALCEFIGMPNVEHWRSLPPNGLTREEAATGFASRRAGNWLQTAWPEMFV